jgi:alkylation response protein AidB-like acyl-CoA dehydrogenase
MTAYQAPIEDIQFVLKELAGLNKIANLPSFKETNPELIYNILVEAEKLAIEVLEPLRKTGDHEGCRLKNGEVSTPEGYPEAYSQFLEGGWNSISSSPKHGGMGLPLLVASASFEIWHGANTAFAMCPTLTQAAIELLNINGSADLLSVYMEKLVSGEWAATMDLTEPQAGSDLSNIRTRAIKKNNQYLITGQKIFITYGEHDYTKNIIHMVLARSPDKIDGVGGLSLYVVPKFLVSDNGKLGERNDLQCLSLEDKMGIHASPTCIMSFGENSDGAIGYLIGKENRGLEYMFTMMNNARLAIGVQSVGVAEHAYQNARIYASKRVQGNISDDSGIMKATTIDQHPDVKRMLLFMRSSTEAIRAITYYASATLDLARHHPDPNTRMAKQSLANLLIPVVKAWASDTGIKITDTAIQVFGGTGYIEDSGAPQFLRDLRIASIWEGTNGIQAMDLVGRKILRDQGVTANALIEEMLLIENDLSKHIENEDIKAISRSLKKSIVGLDESTKWIIKTNDKFPQTVEASAVIYLQLMGTVIGGWLMARAALVAFNRIKKGEINPFLYKKILACRFFADQILIQAPVLSYTVTNGWKTIVNPIEDISDSDSLNITKLNC